MQALNLDNWINNAHILFVTITSLPGIQWTKDWHLWKIFNADFWMRFVIFGFSICFQSNVLIALLFVFVFFPFSVFLFPVWDRGFKKKKKIVDQRNSKQEWKQNEFQWNQRIYIGIFRCHLFPLFCHRKDLFFHLSFVFSTDFRFLVLFIFFDAFYFFFLIEESSNQFRCKVLHFLNFSFSFYFQIEVYHDLVHCGPYVDGKLKI